MISNKQKKCNYSFVHIAMPIYHKVYCKKCGVDVDDIRDENKTTFQKMLGN